MEGFPSTERFDFGRLFSPGLNDETNLGFGSYITQAASIFSPARPNVSMAEQQAQSQGRQQHQLAQQFGLGLDASAPDANSDEAGLFPPTQEYGTGAGSASDSAAARYSPSVSASGVPGAAEADADAAAAQQAQAPTSNRHLSLFVKNFQRHLPFVHVPTIPRLFTDILNDDASLRTSEQARQIDGLKPCTEDLLRAMAIVGAHYDAQALQKQQRAAGGKEKADKRRKLEQPQGQQAQGGEGQQELALDPALAEMDGTAMDRTASSSSSASSVSDYSHDFYGAGELKAKLLGDFADNPPSSTRATFSHHETSGSGSSNNNNNNGSAAAGAGSSNGAGAGSSGSASAGDSGQNGGRAGSTSSSDTGGTPAAGSGGNSNSNRDEPTLLRRAQALALVQFVSLFSRSRPHQNHARLLHGALITVSRTRVQIAAKHELILSLFDRSGESCSPRRTTAKTRRGASRRRTAATAPGASTSAGASGCGRRSCGGRCGPSRCAT